MALWTYLTQIRKRIANNRLREIKTYTLYYGEPADQVLSTLQTFDLVIIEPLLFTREQIALIGSAGARVAGYISIMETPRWNQTRIGRLQEEDYHSEAGITRYFPEWDSWLMDLRQPNFRQTLLTEIGEISTAKEVDGLFLDTVGDIEEYLVNPLVRKETSLAYQTLLKDIRQLYPDLFLIQNRGFDQLEYSLPDLEAVLWENWQGAWHSDEWTRIRVKRLMQAQKRGLKVLTLSQDGSPLHAAEAKKLGFLHATKSEGYRSLN